MNSQSPAFIKAANRIANGESIKVRRRAGEYEVSAGKGAALSSVTFQQGDALQAERLGTFDLVHASNLLCRLPDPNAFLGLLPSLVNDGGRVILATPFSWLEEYTPRSEWPDGDSWQWLQRMMERQFSLVTCADEPFMIREHERKYQWCVSRVSVWQKK